MTEMYSLTSLHCRCQIQELGQIRKQLQHELTKVKDRLEAELVAKDEETSASLPLCPLSPE